MKRVALASAFIAVGLFLSAPLFAGDNDCPMDKCAKRFYCADCKAFMKDAPCEKCSAGGELCEGCKKASMCEHCKKSMPMVDACVRTCYECPGCHAKAPAAGQCAKCKKDMAGTEVCALIVIQCPGCKAEMKEGGHCDKCNMDAKKMCSMNGTCPHCAK